MKKCSKCKVVLPYENFHKKKSTKDGYNSMCKDCRKEKDVEYYQNNKEKIIKRNKEYRKHNKGYIETNRKYREENREFVLSLKREWSKSEKGVEHKKKYYQKNKEIIKESVKKNREKNKEYYQEYFTEYRQRDEVKERNRKYQKEWIKKYRNENPHIVAWRSTLKAALMRMGTEKSGTTLEMLGYSADELKEHMENLFEDGMSWNNWGEWHIDHIKPVSLFESNTEASIVNALSNLQPLWEKENLSKGNSYNE